MKLLHAEKIRFVAKSLLWSLGLYMLCMIFINWDEVSSKTSKTAIPITQIATAPLSNPAPETKPTDPQGNVSALSQALHSAETFLSQLIKVASIFKK